MSTDVVNETITTLADQLVHVQNQIRPLLELQEAIKAELRDHLATAGPGEYQTGTHVLQATATRRLDDAALTAAYPVTTNPALYKLVIDTKAVRATLAPPVVEEFMRNAGVLKIQVQP